MASKEVRVKVILDDNGTIRLTEKSAKKLGGALNNTGVAAQNASKQIKGAAQTATAAGKQFSGMARGAGGVVAAYATLAAQVFAVTAAFNFLKEGGDLKKLYEGQIALSAATGTSYRNLTRDIQRATDAQITYAEAASAAAIGKAAGLSNAQLTALGKAAKDTSAVLGRDLTDSFNRLVRGVTKAEPELLDELGIILRLNTATENYKRVTGAVGELNAFQRTQAVTNEVLTQAEEKFGALQAALEPSANTVKQLGANFSELVDKLKIGAAEGLAPIISLLKDFPALVVAAFLPFTTKVLQAALPGLENLEQSMGRVSEKLTGYKAGLEKTAVDQKTIYAKMAGNEKKRLQQVSQSIAKETTQRKNSLIKQLADGKELTAKQIQSIKANLKKREAAYGITDAKMRQSFINALNAMEAKAKQTEKVIGGVFVRIATGAKIAATSAATFFTGAFATIAAGAAKVGAFLATAFSVVSWVGIIVALGAMAYSFFRTKEEVTGISAELKYFEEQVKSSTEEAEKFIQVQNALNIEVSKAGSVFQGFGNRLQNFSSKILLKNLGDISEGMQKFRGSSEDAIDNLETLKKAPPAPIIAPIMTVGQIEAQQASEAQAKIVRNKELDKKLTEQTAALTKGITLDYLKTAEAQELFSRKQIGALKVLTSERDIVEGINNTRFQSSEAVKEYLENLNGVLNGTKSISQELLDQRTLIMDIGNLYAEEEFLTKELDKNIQSFTNSFLNIGKDQSTLIQIQQILLNTEMLKAAGEEITQDQIDRNASYRETAKILEDQINLQNEFNLAQKTIDNRTQRALIGKTKLVAAEIKAQGELAKIRNNILKIEKDSIQRQTTLKKKFEELAQARERVALTGADKDVAAVNLLEKELMTHQSIIDTNEQDIEQQKIRQEILERQLNTIVQMGEAANQALETSLSANIRDAILGKQDSIRDAFLNIITKVREAAVGKLAEGLTKNIMKGGQSLFDRILGRKGGEEKKEVALDPAAKMEQAFELGGTSAANKIRAALEGQPVAAGGSAASGGIAAYKEPLAPGQALGPTQTAEEPRAGFWATLFGHKREVLREGNVGEVRGDDGIATTGGLAGKPGKGLLGGLETIFGGFKDGLKTMFSKEGGFLEGLSEIFGNGLDGFSQIFSGIGDALGGLFGGGGGGGMGGIFGTALSLFGFANGGYVPGGFQAMASGGVVNTPTLGLIGEGKMNEAVVPLPNGRSIPVDMGGQQSQQQNNVSVNVNMSGDQVKGESNEAQGQNAALMGRLISGAVQREIQNQQRPGGLLSPYSGNNR